MAHKPPTWKRPRLCDGPGCRVRFVPVRKGQRFHEQACRYASWAANRRRVYVTDAQARRMGLA
jgi:hypothetical protein